LSDQKNSFGDDSTMFIPNPQGRNLSRSNSLDGLSDFQSGVNYQPLDQDQLSGLNPLITSANAILMMIPRIRNLISYPNPRQLKEQLYEKVVQFSNLSKKMGVSEDDIFIARYALCTFLDETLASTPWGSSSDLVNKSLLVSFHQDAWGGEKFFQILNKLAEDPVSKIDLIEFYYVCLSLGFEGRYRVVNGGNFELDALRQKLSKLIKNVRGNHEADLSLHWRGENTIKVKSHNYFYLWLSMAFSSILLLFLFMYFSFSLNERADNIAFEKLVLTSHPESKVQEKPTLRLSKFLKLEIDQNLVQVLDTEKVSKVSILGDGLFTSGSATLNQDYFPILKKIAVALNEVPGRVIVLGHTDSQPTRSIRFPSNWHLSKSRAENVGEYLRLNLSQPLRLSIEGMGDSVPIAPNDTDINRERNRRVEILLQVAD